MTRIDPSFGRHGSAVTVRGDLPARLKPVSKKTYSREDGDLCDAIASVPIAATEAISFAEEDEEKGREDTSNQRKPVVFYFQPFIIRLIYFLARYCKRIFEYEM